MKKILLSLICLSLLIPIASAQVYINPQTFEISLMGGENITKNFTVEWKGEAPVVGYLNYSVKQLNGNYEGKELWIDFSQDKLILEPNKPENLQIFIYTLPNIQPDIYNLEITIRVDVEKPEAITLTRTEYLPGVVIKYQNITIEKPVPYIPEEINQTIESLNKSLEEKEEMIANQSREIENLKINLDKLKSANIFLQYLSSGLVLVVVILFSLEIDSYLYKRWKK
jgi:hypothetical protein